MTRQCALIALLATISLTAPTSAADGLPSGDAKQLGFDPDRLSAIESALRSRVDEGKIAGGSALIARRGKVAYQVAVGMADREAGRPMAIDTIVRIASMTKPITSTAVLILVDEGTIALDDPLSKYLPEFAHPTILKPRPDAPEGSPAFEIVPAEGEITIRHLLTHTSGLSYRFANTPHLVDLYVRAGVSDGLSETSGTIGDNTWRIAQVPLAFEPGTAWQYSLATDVLGRVVEVASGQTLDEFFRTRIFEPLGMVDTSFVLPEEKRDRLAAVYEPAEGGGLQPLDGHPEQHGPLVYSASYPTWDDGSFYSGGAGLVSTLGDYARFLQMTLNEGELDGVRLLRPETVEAMTTDQVGALGVPNWGHGQGFGFGFGVVKENSDLPWAAGSYSWGGFFATYFWVDPEHELVGIVFTQSYPSQAGGLNEEILRGRGQRQLQHHQRRRVPGHPGLPGLPPGPDTILWVEHYRDRAQLGDRPSSRNSSTWPPSTEPRTVPSTKLTGGP
ncbi:serine hydrolase domain-containing protein [Tautonia sociabilis]|uniref:Class A beta-lactamase-related serine hydrolase n=1 Tax=Tautonia sociabilis TaxID=2080755 RepID=A0A432MKY3_9BACT|nr:serine hydrolase domain-containing protein [Tautonia sociabilis]RUL88083.1 class A beta-lactamase-related serine hydrolase [Tautonia sociabilis]